MKHSKFKYIALLFIANILLISSSYAQDSLSIPRPPKPPVSKQWKYFDQKEFEVIMQKQQHAIAKAMKSVDSAMSRLNKEKMEKMDMMLADVNRNLKKSLAERKFKNMEFNHNFSYKDQNEVGAYEKTKTISKTYPADANDKLSIINQFGKVDIRTWAKNEFKVDVEIKVNDNSEQQAQEALDGITISDSKSGDQVNFKTNVVQPKNWGNGRKMQVNYTVYMPSKNPLSIENKFGSIILPDLEGALNISSSYGSLTAQSLSNPANAIKVSYGPAKISNLLSTSLKVSYGSLDLTNCGKLNADVSYSSGKIGKMSGDAALNLKYSGGFQIREITPQVKDLNINAAYSSVALNFNPTANFDFDVTVSYAGFNYDNGKVKITSQTPEDNKRGFSPTKNYKGNYGKGSDTNVIIKSNYGKVSFQ